MRHLYALADLVGASDIADRANVRRSTVSNWQARHDTYPAPVTTIGGTGVWYWPAVQRWIEARITADSNAKLREINLLRARLARLTGEQ